MARVNNLTNDTKIIINFLGPFKKKILNFNTNSINLDRFYQYISEEYKKIKKNKVNIKKIDNIVSKNNIYLNNVDNNFNINKQNKYKSNFIIIVKLLKSKYKKILDEIVNRIENEKNKIKIVKFLENIDNKSDNTIIEFMNCAGIPFSRLLFIYFLENKLSDDFIEIIGDNRDLYTQFTSIDIRNDIELNITNKILYNINIHNTDCELILYSKKKNLKLKKHILYRILFLPILLNSQKVEIKIWLSNIKKKLNLKKKYKYIGPKEINSGCTVFTNSYPNRISLWRKEELGKVIIHELIHSLELENKSLLNLYKYFDINEDIIIRTFETYVEIIAQLINLILIVNDDKKYTLKKIRKKSLKNNKLEFNKFKELLKIEILWSYFQCAKVLNYFEYDKIEDFYKLDGFTDKTDKYNQKSNVFSYIILRSIIYYNLGEFINLIYKYNVENILMDNIPNDIKIKFILDSLSLNDNEYLKIINFFINFIKNNRKNDFVFKSMRLSAIETKIF